MRVLVADPDGRLVVTSKPDPTAGRGEVVVEVERCGICGSDLKLWRNRTIGSGCVLGHEISGRVASVGPDVTDLVEGRRVAVMPTRRCGTCPGCRNPSRAARTMVMCERYADYLIGIDERNDGGFAEYVRVPAVSCVAVAPGVSPEQASLVEPYSVALHSVLRSRAADDPSIPVAVIGAGPIGLLAIAALRRRGVQRIAVAERSEARHDAARQLGATAVVTDLLDLKSVLGDPIEVWFDYTGTSVTPPVGMEVLSRDGQLMLVAVDPTASLAFDGSAWLHKELDVQASCGYSEAEFAQSLDEITDGALDLATVLTGARPLDEGEAAFASLASNPAAAKVQLVPHA